jgi:hypothetical protein
MKSEIISLRYNNEVLQTIALLKIISVPLANLYIDYLQPKFPKQISFPYPEIQNNDISSYATNHMS